MANQEIQNNGEFQQKGFLTRPEVESLIGQKMSHTREVMNVGNAIRSLNFETGVAGFQIDANGNAEFNDATMRGTIVATDGTIGGWTIGATTITAGDVTLDSAGKISVVQSLGSIEISGTNSFAFLVGSDHNASIRLRIGVSPVGSTTDVEMTFGVGASSTDFQVSINRTATNTGDLSPTESGTADLGKSSLRWDTIYLSNSPDVSSSKSLKKNIKPSRYGLDTILELEPVEYEWKKQSTDRGRGKMVGLIAEDVRRIIPEIAPIEGSYRPTDLIPILVNAVKELTLRVKELEAQV